jgi:hypothetical protein
MTGRHTSDEEKTFLATSPAETQIRSRSGSHELTKELVCVLVFIRSFSKQSRITIEVCRLIKRQGKYWDCTSALSMTGHV